MTGTLHKINWNEFKVKQDNSTGAFEDLCYHLFCRKYNLSEGIRVNYNHVGLETDPVKNKKGELVGFQSKFFENKLSDGNSITQINHSLDKAKAAYPGLHTVIIYTHQSFGSDAPAYKIEIETKATPLIIEWFTDSKFKAILSKPANLDLAQFYFGRGSEFAFVQYQLSTTLKTFLPSVNYIPLPLKDSTGKAEKCFRKMLLDSSEKIFLIVGNPGSGKSILLYRLFYELSGMEQATADKMYNALLKTGAIPMLINLRNCVSESIENLIRARQNDNKIRDQNFKFIYIFDGLDELTERRADDVLAYLRELANKSDTHKMLFSCRSGNANRLKTKIFFPGTLEFSIAELSKLQVDAYFKAKGDPTKTGQLTTLRLDNPPLIKNIHDILLLKLLWDTIGSLDTASTIIDLLDQKMKLLIYSPEHKKHIEELNLLNPKGEKILHLHEEIAFRFQKKFQFRFSIRNLQALILQIFDLGDYHSVNLLVNYLSDLFFENTYADLAGNQTYIYQHRRYQEYFFVKKLKKEYEKDPHILRDLEVISNREFFENFFLPFLRSAYLKERNLIGNMELNLIDVYQGRNTNFGADNPMYQESDRFIYAVSTQGDITFEQLLHDDNIGIRQKLFLNLPGAEEVNEMFSALQRDKNDYDTEQALINLWETGAKKLINFCANLHKNGKTAEAAEIKEWLIKVRKIYHKHNFKIPSKFERPQLHDPFFDSWESWLYIVIVINHESPKEILGERIRKNYKHFGEDNNFTGFEESSKDKFFKSLLRVCLKYRLNELPVLAADFDLFENLSLIRVLADKEYIHFLLVYPEIQKLASKILAKSEVKGVPYDLSVLFIRKILGVTLTAEEVAKARSEFKQLRERNEISIKYGGRLDGFICLSHILDVYNFNMFLDQAEETRSVNFYYDLGLFATLFGDYIAVLKGAKTLQEVLRDYKKYIETYTKNNEKKDFKNEMSELLADLFARAPQEVGVKTQLKRLLVFGTNSLNGLKFYGRLKTLNPVLTSQLLTKPDLEKFSKDLALGENGYSAYVDKCFDLSYLYAGLDDVKSIEYMVKGINDGTLRHGWRKDVIVSHNLVDALEILYRNGWESNKQLREYAKQVFAMTVKVTDITDGKGTWRGPYRAVDMVANYDLKLAEKFADKIRAENYHTNPELITSIIKGKVKLGLPVTDLEKDFERYRKRYVSNNTPRSDYFTEKFKAHLFMAESGLYTDIERSKALTSARKQVVDAIEESGHVSWDNELRDEIPVYRRLCNLYNEPFNIPLPETTDNPRRVYDPDTEKEFIAKLSLSQSQDDLTELYKTVSSAAETLQQPATWELIVAMTYAIDGDIKRLIAAMQKNHYPHSDYYSYGNAYYHFGLAAAIKNLNTRIELLNFLFEHSGYDGFLNVMKAYEALGDHVTCKLLFSRFYGFCNLLVN
jgi:GTPase SAR1 family protein